MAHGIGVSGARRRILISIVLLVVDGYSMAEIGLKLGDTAPSIEASDQFGRAQNLKSLSGHNGLVLLFFRSADW
jgi:hypothetical protein